MDRQLLHYGCKDLSDLAIAILMPTSMVDPGADETSVLLATPRPHQKLRTLVSSPSSVPVQVAEVSRRVCRKDQSAAIAAESAAVASRQVSHSVHTVVVDLA